MTVQMHIKLPYFLGLWLYLHLSGIHFPAQLFPPSFLPPKLWMVTCPYFSAGLVSEVGGLPSSSFLVLLSFMLSSLLWIVNGNKTGSLSDVLGDSLALYGTIISILNCSTRNPLTKSLFVVIIEDLIVCKNGHKNMFLHATPSLRVRKTVTCFTFTKKECL